MEDKDTGLLLNAENIKLQRFYFEEMLHLLGINTLFRSIKNKNKQYDMYGELDANYNPPIVVPCIFNEHTDQYSMKKMGWIVEKDTTTPVIHVPYDLKGLEAGCLFIIPSGLDNSQGRVFRVIRMSNIAIYPASIACELGPVYESSFERSQLDMSNTDFNLLKPEEED